MSSGPLKLVHLAPRARGIGGIETLLARHAAADTAAGFDAVQVGLFDPPRAEPRFTGLGFGGRHTPQGMRRVVARTLAPQAGAVLAWHNAWGLPWFADDDGASRRIVVLHAHRNYFEGWLPGLRDDLDGILAVSPAIARDAAALLPGWPAKRLQVLPLPVDAPPGLKASRPERATWVLGCAGRLTYAQKRWDRLVPCVEELRRLGVDFRLEIIGDGPLRLWLEQRLGADPAITFLGFVDNAEYWRRLSTWDAALFFSEVEGGPIVMLEAMAAGVLPVYPGIGGSVGDDYAPQLTTECYYEAGNPLEAARSIDALRRRPFAQLEALRSRAQALVRPHQEGGYERTFAAFVRRIAAQPRISRVARGRRWHPLDLLPLGLITRSFPAHLWR